MIRKLLALAHGDIAGDSPDSPMNQELLLVGDLLTWQLRVEYLLIRPAKLIGTSTTLDVNTRW